MSPPATEVVASSTAFGSFVQDGACQMCRLIMPHCKFSCFDGMDFTKRADQRAKRSHSKFHPENLRHVPAKIA